LIAPIAPWLEVDEAEVIRSAVYRFHGLVATRWSEGRILLAGDAVHQTPPFYGQGMCHGMRDVLNAVWKISHVLRGQADAELLDSYQLEREPHVRAIIEAAIENGRYICTLDPEVAAARDRGLRERLLAGADVGSFSEVIPGLADGLLDPARGVSPAIGRPFPQPRVSSGVLLDELLGTGFALVTRARLDSDEALDWFAEQLGGRVVGVADKTVHAWLDGVGCDSAIVRPDRYVFGVASGAAGTAGLVDRLRALLGRPSLAEAAGTPKVYGS
jgi:3-(3-hydroxy-phenyl)propionate hydroxylase